MLDADPPTPHAGPTGEPPVNDARYLRIGTRLVDRDTHRLLAGDESRRLTPKALAVLVELARAGGRTRSRDELLDSAWRGTSPTPEVVSQIIKELRRTLDTPGQASLIETVPRAGYRLTGPTQWLAQLPADGAPPDSAPPAVAADAAGRPDASPRWRPRMPVVPAMLMLLAAVAAAVLLRPQADEQIVPAPAAVAPVAVTMLTADKGRESYPRLSPDGGLVAFGAFDPATGREQIRLLSTAGGNSRVAASDPTRDLRYPAWSPDGSHLAYQAAAPQTCELRMQAVLGGAARTLGSCWPHMLQPFDFTPVGGIIAAGIRRPAEPQGRMPHLQAGLPIDWWPGPPPGSEVATEPRMSPDGRWLAFRAGFSPQSMLMLRSLPDGEALPVGNIRGDIRGLDWTADSRALVIGWVRDGRPALYRVERDSGAASPLGVDDAQYPDVARHADIVVFERLRLSSRLVSLPLPVDTPSAAGDASTPVTALTTVSTAVDTMGAHSPDGRRLAFVSSRSGGDQIWLASADGNDAAAVTAFDSATIRGLDWSGDSRQLLMLVQQAAGSTAWLLDVGSARLRAVSDGDSVIRAAVFGAGPGEIWLLRQVPDGWQLLQQSADGRQRLQPTPAIGLRRDPRRATPWRMDPGYIVRPIDDSEAPIPLINLGGFDDWGVFDGRVWVAQVDREALRLRRWNGDAFVDWVRVDGRFDLHGMRVMPHADGHAVLPQLVEDDSDIGLFQLPR